MPVYVSRLSQWIEKRWNAKGGHVIDDIDVVSRVVLPWAVGVEDRYLQGWQRFGVVANQAAVAAQFSRCRIRNPAGSNVIAVLEQLEVFSSVADNPFVNWVVMGVDLANLVVLTAARMDPRGNSAPTCIVSNNAQAASGQPFLQRNTGGSNTNLDFINSPDQQIPILPGNGVDVSANVANTNIIVSFMWRERALELSELT